MPPSARRRSAARPLVALLCTCLFYPVQVTARPAAVAAEHRLAVEAGIEVLERGGNAVDAAVATALAVCVANPSSCGLGGGGFALVYDRSRARLFALDYRETAPAAASRDMFVAGGRAIPERSRRGGLAVAVPGEVAGLAHLLERFGRLTFAEVAAPAIRLARRGFAVERHLAETLSRLADDLRERPALAAVYLKDDGEPLRAGDRLVQDDLGRTLEAIAAGGADAFYRGPIAQAIVAAVRAAGGRMSTADLSGYRPIWRLPVEGRLGAWKVYGMPPPSSGGGVLLEILGILAAGPLPPGGLDSPAFAHLFVEACQFGFADRARFYGDPDFVRVPLEDLLSPERAAVLRSRIDPERTFPPEHYGSVVAPVDTGTSHLSVIDGGGNAVAMTTSINTAFGSLLLVPGTGIVLNNTMDDFSAQPGVPNTYGLVGSEANAIAPGKRPLSSMAPTIALRGREVAFVGGASGGPFIITATAQVLLRSLLMDQPLPQAVAAPRLHHQWLPPVLLGEPSVGDDLRRELAGRGHRWKSVPALGAVQAIRTRPGAVPEAAADPRKGGAAAVSAAGWRRGRR